MTCSDMLSMAMLYLDFGGLEFGRCILEYIIDDRYGPSYAMT